MRIINYEETFFVHLLPFHVHMKFKFYFLFIREKFFINLGAICIYAAILTSREMREREALDSFGMHLWLND